MFTQSQMQAQLEKEIERSLAKLADVSPESENYEKIVEQVAKLHKMKEDERPFRFHVTADTALLVATNILGILLITRYERENIVTSKALNFAQKIR